MLLAHAEQGRWRGSSSVRSSCWGGARWGEGGAGRGNFAAPSSSSSSSPSRSSAAQLNLLGALALRDATGATPAELAAGRNHRLLAARLEREAKERGDSGSMNYMAREMKDFMERMEIMKKRMRGKRV